MHAFFCLASIALTVTAAGAQPAVVNRTAEIRAGTCANPGETIAVLANVVLTAGDPLGQSGATPVEQSGTVVPFTLSDFLAAAHAIVVRQSPEMSDIVACGEIGGAVNPDGTLGVGLRSVGGSGISGVGYFTPINTVESVLVTILLVSEGAVSDAVVSTEPSTAAESGTSELDKDVAASGTE